MSDTTIRPRQIVRDFSEVMELGMERGDRHGWVWDDEARRNADPHDLVERAIDNLRRGREQMALGEPESAQECFADAANLTMLTYDLMCYFARMAYEYTRQSTAHAFPLYDGPMGRGAATPETEGSDTP